MSHCEICGERLVRDSMGGPAGDRYFTQVFEYCPNDDCGSAPDCPLCGGEGEAMSPTKCECSECWHQYERTEEVAA